MDASRTGSLAPPPGVIGSLRAGFDTIATHITAILLPVILDLWLWLGPRLGVKEFYQSLEAPMVGAWRSTGLSAAQLQSSLDLYRRTLAGLDSVNLAAAARTFPIGISSLMSGMHPAGTPLGEPVVYQVGSFIDLFGWAALLTLFGWIGGYLYFRWVASLVVQETRVDGSQVGGPFVHSILMSLIWAALALALGPPFTLLVQISLGNPVLQFAILLLLVLFSMWLVVPLYFSPLGIFIRRQNVFGSILSSLQLARFTLANSSLFVLTVLLISLGLNFVWSIPDSNSWMSLIGILGHAFISTALLAASFIYYRDMTAWLQSVFERIKAGPASSQT